MDEARERLNAGRRCHPRRVVRLAVLATAFLALCAWCIFGGTQTWADDDSGTSTITLTIPEPQSPSPPVIFGNDLDVIIAGSNARIGAPGGVWSNRDFKMPGSGNIINGNVRANRDLTVSGSSNIVVGAAEYGRSASVAHQSGPNRNVVTVVKVDPVIRPYPIYVQLQHFRQDNSFASWTISGDNVSVEPGTYYVLGNIDIKAKNSNLSNVTFIAGGSITVSGSGNTFRWNQLGMVFYSLTGDVRFSGSGTSWQGDVFAPNGMVDCSGGDSHATGSIVGRGVRIDRGSWVIE